jgi:hypothetical protein
VTTTVGAPSDAELARRSARLRLPTWLAGNNPIEFGRMCRWRMEVADLAGGEWDVRLEERVKRKPARVVQANRLATMSNVDTVGAYSRLRRLSADTALFRSMPYDYIQAELNRLGAQRPDDLAVLMYRATLATGTVTPDHLAGIVQQVLRDFLLPLLPEAAVYLVEVDRALAMRYGATRLLLQAQDYEAMFARPPAARANETVFNSARGLFSDTSLGLGPTFRRSSWLFPRGYGRCPRCGPAASSSTRSAAWQRGGAARRPNSCNCSSPTVGHGAASSPRSHPPTSMRR